MSEPTKEWWHRILNCNPRKKVNTIEQKVHYVPNPEVVYDITLPLGTSFHVQTSNETVFGEQKVLLGILGELEKQIFELKERVYKLESYQSITAERIETLLSSLNKKVSEREVFNIHW